jgi:UPF0716 family protein affecting phage T7 exclusion
MTTFVFVYSAIGLLVLICSIIISIKWGFSLLKKSVSADLPSIQKFGYGLLGSTFISMGLFIVYFCLVIFWR